MKKRIVFRGKFVTVRQWRQPLPNGTKALYEQTERPGSVIIFPMDAQGNITIIREKRFGTKNWIWHVPCGKVERGQSVLQAAKQELAEEAGLRAARWKRVGGEIHQSGITVWRVDVFVARQLTPVLQHREPGEETRPITVTLLRAYRLAIEGKMHYAYVAYYLIRLWHNRKTWLR